MGDREGDLGVEEGWEGAGGGGGEGGGGRETLFPGAKGPLRLAEGGGFGLSQSPGSHTLGSSQGKLP
jgi:hypothetical protein